MEKSGSTSITGQKAANSITITMRSNAIKNIALGVPGQVDGRPTLQSDRGDETQQQFSYQAIAGVVLLCGALVGENDYIAVWMEHHDDLLVECSSGELVAVQSKTSTNEGEKWFCADAAFIDAVKKFCANETKHGPKIRNYLFFSNIKPHVPGANAKKPASLAKSPQRLVDESKRKQSFAKMEEPYKATLATLSTATGYDPEVVFSVVRKMMFHKGPSMEAFSDQLSMLIAAVPECKNLPFSRLTDIGRKLYDRLHSASILDTSLLSLQSSPLATDGRPEAAVRAKRVSVEEAKQLLMRHPAESFLYDNDSERMVTLGKVTGQKEILRSKMKAGGVENLFRSIWLQAIAAEKRLMEEVLLDPQLALKKLLHLEGVVLVECQNAEAAAGGLPDDARGREIFNRIVTRTEELSRNDSDQVLNERAETLRGMAGMLSGSCHFAWGMPLPEDVRRADGV